jgi:eukaryotic-like serine/threonine-protein kinase
MSTPSDRSDRSRAPAVREHAEDAEGREEVDPYGKASGVARKSERPGGPEALVGAVLGGRYRIIRLIGEGGMGAVYQAEHTHMRKRLAVKVLHPEMSRLPEVVTRFEREAMAAAHMDHLNVAGATDFGKLDDGSFFLVLEYVEGDSLRDALAKGRLELGRALHILRQIASALARAHALGIVHRDLKPENIMLVLRDGDTNFVKVLDFGIAKVPVGSLFGDAQAPGQALTQIGMVYGTPEYMAPEQALGQPVDGRADLYALGAMAFEMISGVRPYNHESKVTLLGMHVAAPIPKMADRAPDALIPPEIDAIVSRLLAKDANARFADARALIEALDAITTKLIEIGAIAESVPLSSLAQSPRASAPRLPRPDAASASPLALGPTKRAESTPNPIAAPGSSRALARLWAWARSKPVAGAVSMLGVVALVALAAFASFAIARRGAGAPDSSAAGAGEAGSVKATPAPADTKGDAIVASAQATIDRGDFATAIDVLVGLEKKDPARADVHMLLERAYTGARNPHEAMRETGLWLAVDPNAVTDLKMQEDVRNAALIKDTQDDAFGLLESKMGARGVDILYDIAHGASGRLYPQAALRAKHSLDLEDVRGRASPALEVLLAFRDSKSCDEKRALLERVRDQGDARMLAVLQPYEATRGCGFLGRSDCYPCMHKDKQLVEAASAIEERSRR